MELTKAEDHIVSAVRHRVSSRMIGNRRALMDCASMVEIIDRLTGYVHPEPAPKREVKRDPQPEPEVEPEKTGSKSKKKTVFGRARKGDA